MKTLNVFAIVAGTAMLTAVPVSLEWSPEGVSLSLDRAQARIGRPATAMSVAGVHRRADRRAYRRAAYAGVAGAGLAGVGAYGLGSYYGGYGYPAYGSYGYPTYGYSGYGYPAYSSSYGYPTGYAYSGYRYPGYASYASYGNPGYGYASTWGFGSPGYGYASNRGYGYPGYGFASNWGYGSPGYSYASYNYPRFSWPGFGAATTTAPAPAQAALRPQAARASARAGSTGGASSMEPSGNFQAIWTQPATTAPATPRGGERAR